MEEIDSIKDFENIKITEVCRACFKTCKQYKDLLDEAESTDKQTLGDVFVDVVKIDIKSNAKTKPSRLCLTCCYDLTSAYNFIKKSQKNNELLNQYLKCEPIKKHDCLHEIPIDVPIDQIVPDFQIKVEDETISDYADSMPVEFIRENSYDSDGSDYEPTAKKKLKIEKLQCAYCTQLFDSQDCEIHMKTMHPEECQSSKEIEEESECNLLECEECDFCSISKLDMESHRNAEHKTRQQLNSKELKARLKTDRGEFKRKLISEVKKHCCIYAKNSPDYRNRTCRDKAWEDIALVMGKTVYECQKKWTSLRDTFRTIFREEYCNSSRQGRNSKPRWANFEELKFLIPYIEVFGNEFGYYRTASTELHGDQVTPEDPSQTIGQTNREHAMNDQSKKMKLGKISKKPMDIFFQDIAKRVEHFSATRKIELQGKILVLLATDFAEDLK